MRTKTPTRSRLATVLILSMAVAACGSDGGSTSTPTAATGTAPPTSPFTADQTSPVTNESQATTASSAGTAAAPSDDEGLDELIAAAQAEGSLMYYASAVPEQNDALAAAFTEKYGIDVETLRIATAGLIERFAGEQQAGVASADVVNVSLPDLFEDSPDWFVPLADAVPGYENYPDTARSERSAINNISPAVITYNTDLVPPELVPTKWEDLLNPAFKDHLLLSDPRATPTYMGWGQLMINMFGIEYLEKMRTQNPALVESSTPGAQQVAAGAYWMNFPAAPSHSAELRAQGAPVGIVFLKEGTNGPANESGIVANAPHPNAARLFVHFTLSEEGQRALCGAAESSSPLGDLDECIELPASWEPVIHEVWGDPEAEGKILGALGIAR